MTYARFDDVVVKGSDHSCLVLFANLDEATGVLQVDSETICMGCFGEPPIVSFEPLLGRTC